MDGAIEHQSPGFPVPPGTALDRLDANIERAVAAAFQLRDRLTPVLVASPEPSLMNVRADASSPIMGRAERVSDIADSLEALLRELDI